jgi:hypothetical protein
MTRARLGWMRDRHRGERCVIVANGPSLRGMDLAFLRRETVIGMNKIFLGFEDFGFYPRYFVAVNPTVVQQAAPHIRALNCVKFIGSRAAEGHLQDDGLTCIVDTRHPPARFSPDLRLGLHEGWTVTHAALQVAYHLGFSEVGLIGLDHRYRFEGQPNEARQMQGADPNHFSDRYFGYGQNWDNPDLARSEESYRAAQQAYQRDQRRIVDATVGGACSIFPKVDYRRHYAV